MKTSILLLMIALTSAAYADLPTTDTIKIRPPMQTPPPQTDTIKIRPPMQAPKTFRTIEERRAAYGITDQLLKALGFRTGGE